MFKSNGGFTLVELIVVIAILGLLAGVSVPLYSNYVDKAKTEITEASASESVHASIAESVADIAGMGIYE